MLLLDNNIKGLHTFAKVNKFDFFSRATNNCTAGAKIAHIGIKSSIRAEKGFFYSYNYPKILRSRSNLELFKKLK